MPKYEAREPEIVDAYQFIGGEKDGLALVNIIGQHGGASARWRPEDRTNQIEHIKVVTDSLSDYIVVGEWVLIMEDDTITHMADSDFKERYRKVRTRPSVLIWKDIPGFPNWQVSDNGRVRNVGYAS